ncbi:MAG TPA: hypothetical protein VM694_08060 [Polyangium sp.]|nr:hypothetical protein [Polyangium sp.]
MQHQREPEETFVLGPASAGRALRARFGTFVGADYLPGKTAMRDALCDRFGVSQLEAEELCDALEASGALRFISTPDGEGFHIDSDVVDEAA